MSDGNKNSLLAALSPYCLSKEDIYSNQDINYLLSVYPHVEQRHPKLWLSSSAVLDRFINNDIISRTKILFEEISEDAAKYVQNASFSEARKVIDELGYCIISGIPGIGKTTLAKMLLLNYNIEGFEPVYVSEDIDEAYRLLKPEIKQAIYFDDFLGKTKFNPTSLNFDKRLVDFIKAVKRSKNTVFILTTREYILNQAVAYYEDLELNKSLLDNGKCIISLSDYTRGQKALILYNHLYHSILSRDDLKSLTSEKVHRIISHRNYLPRVIDWVIRNKDVSHGEDLADKLLKALNNPKEIWKAAFQRHISQSGKAIIIFLFTFGDTSIERLRQGYTMYTNHLLKLGRLTTTEVNFEDSLRELEGSFININPHRHVSFHNPSIIDYLEDFFRANPDEIYLVIDSIKHQRLLWQLIRRVHHPYGLRSEPMRYFLSSDVAISKLVLAEQRLRNQVKDNMTLDDQKLHVDNLKYAGRITKELEKRSEIRKMLVNYITDLASKENMFVRIHLESIETLTGLSHLYDEITDVKKSIDSFLDKNIDAINDLSLVEDVQSMVRGTNLPENLKQRVYIALDRSMKLAALSIDESFSSSNLSRFEEMYASWEDLGFADTHVQQSLESVYINQARIENGEVDDEDFEPEPDEDDDRGSSSSAFTEDVIDYDDVIDLIGGLDSSE